MIKEAIKKYHKQHEENVLEFLNDIKDLPYTVDNNILYHYSEEEDLKINIELDFNHKSISHIFIQDNFGIYLIDLYFYYI